jgi:hypothetical protein
MRESPLGSDAAGPQKKIQSDQERIEKLRWRHFIEAKISDTADQTKQSLEAKLEQLPAAKSHMEPSPRDGSARVDNLGAVIGCSIGNRNGNEPGLRDDSIHSRQYMQYRTMRTPLHYTFALSSKAKICHSHGITAGQFGPIVLVR